MRTKTSLSFHLKTDQAEFDRSIQAALHEMAFADCPEKPTLEEMQLIILLADFVKSLEQSS